MINAITPETSVAFFCSAHAPGFLLECVHALPFQLENLHIKIVNGFHTPIEKVFFEQLCKTQLSMTWVRAFQTVESPQVPLFAQKAYQTGRLVITHAPDCKVTRATRESSWERNNYIAQMCEVWIVGYTPKGSSTYQLIQAHVSQKQIYTFDHPENKHLLALGVRPIEIKSSASDNDFFSLENDSF